MSGSAVFLGGLEAALDRAGSFLPRLVSGLHSRARGETRGVKGYCGHLQGGWLIKVSRQTAAGKSSFVLNFLYERYILNIFLTTAKTKALAYKEKEIYLYFLFITILKKTVLKACEIGQQTGLSFLLFPFLLD